MIPVVSLTLNHRLHAFILVRIQIHRRITPQRTAMNDDGEPMLLPIHFSLDFSLQKEKSKFNFNLQLPT
jgi:hypothetical protein